ncbi:MAG TPA: LysR family transcriptional regulator [Myxococcota bacterium]|nr:LysR family transcriptional regulator [Myxococcota bacterium]HND30488.1 LysR family transcriptional regulator [Myxococcota bacterium]HNH46762.1 LysR family transcriptional regulator [Myxococcota bacterium]
MQQTPLDHFDLNLLRTLNVLLEERSVSRAAARVGITQSAMSRALGRLREGLGDPLLVPAGRGLQPTSRALALAGPLREILADVRIRVLSPSDFDPSTAQRRFLVSSTDYTDTVLMPRVYRALAGAAPGVAVDLVGPGPAFSRGLEEAQVDLAVGIAAGAGGSLRARTLFRDGWGCLVPGELSGPLSLERWLTTPHVVVRTTGSAGGPVDAALERRGLSRTIGARVHSFALVPAIVAATGWIATLPRRMAASGGPGLRFEPVPLELPELSLSMLWHRRSHHDPAHSWFRELVTRIARESPDPVDSIHAQR